MAARTKPTQTRLALLGLFALTAIILLAVGLYLVSNAGPGRGNYRMGVHFATAAGVAPGSQVYLSGVNIGTVNKVKILPDNSVEMILGIRSNTDIPKRSKFSIQSSLTGSPTIAISPPRNPAPLHGSPAPLPQSEVWAKRILPLAQQPVGSEPASLEDFMREGQALGGRAQSVLGRMQARRGPMLAALEHSRSNAFATKDEMTASMTQLQAQMAATMDKAHANIAQASQVLQTRDQAKLAQVAASFKATAQSAQNVQASMQSVTRDPAARASLRESAEHLRATLSNMRALTTSMQGIASNPQTRAQLRDAGAHLRAAIEKLKSLL